MQSKLSSDILISKNEYAVNRVLHEKKAKAMLRCRVREFQTKTTDSAKTLTGAQTWHSGEKRLMCM